MQTWATGFFAGMGGRNPCLLNARGQWIVKWVSLESFISRHVPKCFAGTAPSLQVHPCWCLLQPRRDRGSVCIKGSGPIPLCLLFIVSRLWAFPSGRGWGATHPLGVCREEIWRIWASRMGWRQQCWPAPRSSLPFLQGWHESCRIGFPANTPPYSPETRDG